MMDPEQGWNVLRHIGRCLVWIRFRKAGYTGRNIQIGGTRWMRASVVPCVFGEVTLRLLNSPRRCSRSAGLASGRKRKLRFRSGASTLPERLLSAAPPAAAKPPRCTLLQLRGTIRSVVTIEDPVEYRIDGVTQLEVHERNLSFTDGLRRSSASTRTV